MSLCDMFKKHISSWNLRSLYEIHLLTEFVMLALKLSIGLATYYLLSVALSASLPVVDLGYAVHEASVNVDYCKTVRLPMNFY